MKYLRIIEDYIEKNNDYQNIIDKYNDFIIRNYRYSKRIQEEFKYKTIDWCIVVFKLNIFAILYIWKIFIYGNAFSNGICCS